MPVVLFFMLLILITVVVLVRKGHPLEEIAQNKIFMLIVIGLFSRFFITFLRWDHATDAYCFTSWANKLFSNGLFDFYGGTDFTDYPPGYMYILFVLRAIQALFRITEGSQSYNILMKLPSILADIGMSLFVYKLAFKRFNEKRAFEIALFYVLNPAVIIISAAWGQVDAIHTLIIVWSIYWIIEKKYFGSFLLFVFAFIVKPQSFMFSPIYLYTIWTDFRENHWNKETWFKWIKWGLVCVGLVFLLLVPFSSIENGFTMMPIIQQYIDTLASYPYATVNAYNLFAMLGLNWAPIDGRFLGLTYNAWAMGGLVLAVFISFWQLHRGRDKGPSNLYFTAAFLNFWTFMFSVKMHERYSFPIMALLIMAYVYNRNERLKRLYVGASAVFFLNYYDVLRQAVKGLSQEVIALSSVLFSLAAFLVFIYFVYLMMVLFGEERQSKQDPFAVLESANFLEDSKKEEEKASSLSEEIGFKLAVLENDQAQVQAENAALLDAIESKQQSGEETTYPIFINTLEEEESIPLYPTFIGPPEAANSNRKTEKEAEEGSSTFEECEDYTQERSYTFEIEEPEAPPKFTKKDFIVVALITAVYTLIAFFYLGNTASPQTFWEGEKGVPVVIQLKEESDLAKAQFLLGPRHDQKFQLEASLDGEHWNNFFEVEVNSVFSWGEFAFTDHAKFIRITPNTDELILFELAFRDKENNIVPVYSVKTEHAKDAIAMFDEQNLVPERRSSLNSTYFDEIYHARTAYEFEEGLYVYEWTHPPLGKFLISLGIKAFGMTPFGWRFVGTLTGVLMVPLMFLFGKRMFKETFWAGLVTILFTFDFMHFVQTRIATIDSYITFFVIAMYYFMYKYYKTSFYKVPFKKTLVPLALSGLCMGLGIASKWPGVYAGAGLAIIFLLVMLQRYDEYKYAKRHNIEGEYHKFWRYALKTCAWCVLFFVVIPVLVYVLSYIPYYYGTKSLYANYNNIQFLADKPFLQSIFRENTVGQFLAAIIQNQISIFNYHSKLVSEHPYSSTWIQWMGNVRPIYYYSGTVSDTVREGISSFGNPAVWWGGLVGLLFCIIQYVRKYEKTACFLIIAFLAQLVPWMLVTRTTYIYHYFPSVPFLVLMIVFTFKSFVDKGDLAKNVVLDEDATNDEKMWHWLSTHRMMWVWIYGGIVVILFAMFYPVLAGYPVNVSYVEMFLKWLPGWQLI